MIEHWTLMPGAEIVEFDDGHKKMRAQFGVPPCIKLWFQRKLTPPTTFVLPHKFFHRGVVQVALEFFLYYFLFAMGKAFGRLGEDENLVVIGTADQLERCKRFLTVSLFGFDEDEMRSWRDGAPLTEADIRLIRDSQLFLSPKRNGFDEVRAFIEANPDPAKWTVPEGANPLLKAFLASHSGTDPVEARRAAYAFCRIQLEDAVQWRAFDASSRTELFDGISIERHQNGQFTVSDGDRSLHVNTDFDEDQAPWLVTLPPAAQAVSQETFRVLCLGADPGFETEHPTTGFALCLNGSWAVVDAPLCASYLLAQHGVDPADVRVVFETHGHEDHMGSGIHFMLEYITSGRTYTYVAAEPVYRTCVVKVAAVLGIAEDDAHALLSRPHNDASDHGPRGSVIRVSPHAPLRLLGAMWYFFWTVHPVATTGFRIELEHEGKMHVLSYSSDTAPLNGDLGVRQMQAQGFLADNFDPYRPMLRGDEDIVFFEAGGTAGDPIHFNARDWDEVCQRRGVRPTVVFMHAHPLPSLLRGYALARPGMVWTLVTCAPLETAQFIKLVKALRFFDLEDDEYWLWMFLSQGKLESYFPGATVQKEDERRDSWFIVLQGEAEVVVSDHGTRRVVGVLGSSAFFGDIARDGQALGVRAISHLDVWRLPGEVLREFILGNGLWDFFAQLWSNVEGLRQSRLFLGFPHQVLAGLAQRATRRDYHAGDELMRRGEVGLEMFVILDGQVEVSARDGRPATVCGPGELLGEYGVFVPGARRSATVSALTDLRVLVLTRDIVDDIVAGQIPLHLRLVSLLEDRGLPAPPVAAQQ